MKLKPVILLIATALLSVVLAGCAQDSTNTTDENPAMQEAIRKGEDVSVATGAAKQEQSASTNTTRTQAKGGTSGTKLNLSADPSGALKYTTTKLNANAGLISIAFTNPSTVPHDVAVSGQGGKQLGKSATITKSNDTLVLKDVKAGSYTFYCTVPGHRQAGMQGTLTVR
jgi:plastocyanin